MENEPKSQGLELLLLDERRRAPQLVVSMVERSVVKKKEEGQVKDSLKITR